MSAVDAIRKGMRGKFRVTTRNSTYLVTIKGSRVKVTKVGSKSPTAKGKLLRDIVRGERMMVDGKAILSSAVTEIETA